VTSQTPDPSPLSLGQRPSNAAGASDNGRYARSLRWCSRASDCGTTSSPTPAATSSTASAVVADLVDVTRMHTADPEQRVPHLAFQPDRMSDLPILSMDEVQTSYYLRLRVKDQPGVLADITRILADQSISIDAMVQKEPGEGEDQVDIIMLTHLTLEKSINGAIRRIESLPVVSGKVTRIRLEELGKH